MANYRVIQSHCDGAATVHSCDDKTEAMEYARASQERSKKSPWGPVMHTVYGYGRRLRAFTEQEVLP